SGRRCSASCRSAAGRRTCRRSKSPTCTTARRPNATCSSTSWRGARSRRAGSTPTATGASGASCSPASVDPASNGSGRVIRFCRRCGASLGPSARFCGACGAATRDYRLQHRAALRDAARQDRRRALVLGVVFVGVIAGLVLPHLLVPEGEVSSTVTLAFDLLLGAAVVAWLGRGAWRTAIGRWPGPTAFLLALPVAAVSLL